MKVLVLGTGLPRPGSLGGIFELDQAQALAAAGHEVVYCALDVRFVQHRRPWGLRHSERDGIPVVELSVPLGKAQFWFDYRPMTPLWTLLYRAATRAHGTPDIVHAHFIGRAAAAARAKARLGYPLVVTEHTSWLMAPTVAGYMLRGIRAAYAGADRLLAVSPALQARINELTGHDATYLPNIVDAASFAELDLQPHQGLRAVAVGNLIPRKRVDMILDALTHPGLEELELVVIGDGPEREALTTQAGALGLTGRVRFAGAVDHDGIAAELARADLLVLASQAETFGVVLIEAMAAGLPVVSTRSGGPDGFVTPDVGVLTDHTVDSLADGLRTALATPWNAAAIRAHALAHYSPPVIAGRLTELYEQILAERAAR